MLEVSHLKKTYGDHQVIEDVSFQAQPGGVYGFLGPNGVGKSTTMNMLTGYLAPDAGSVLVDGVSMQREPERAKRMVGYLPEQPPLYPDLRVGEYLSYAAELKGVRGGARGREVDRVLALLDLNYVRGRLIRQLSKGYKQRVGLAQALLADPKVLVLDEPSSGLDPKQIVDMRRVIRSLGEDHVVLLSTHILSEVTALCSHVMVLSWGRLVADDAPDALLERYNERQNIRLVLKGNASAAERAISRLEGGAGVAAHRIVREDADTCEIDVAAQPGQDVRELLSGACIRAGYVILELSVRRVTLEEVYLMLTQPGVQASQGAQTEGQIEPCADGAEDGMAPEHREEAAGAEEGATSEAREVAIGAAGAAAREGDDAGSV